MTNTLIGQELDGYLIETLLGQGGMARVYRARDVRIGRYVAVKVIEPDVNADPEYTMRFEKEARAVGQLDHPNIVSIYRFGEVNNLHYMAMQYVDGADLGWVMNDYGAENELLPLDDALRIITQIGSALDYAHSQGVIHRDIKPSNVLLDKNGKAILTDFGLVLLQTEGTHGEIFGTPQYIAPEQAINSASVVPQSDIYALGVILYEMLTGHVPFDDGSSMDIAMAHVSEPPPPPQTFNPNLHPAFLPVLDMALKKEPRERYQSGRELAQALAQAVNSAQLSQQPTKPASVHVSMLEVPEKVSKFRADNPLPPLVAQPPLPPPPPVMPPMPPPPISPAPPTAPAYASPAPRSTPTRARRERNQMGVWLLVGIASGIVLLVGAAAILALVLLRNGSQATPTPETIAPSTDVAQSGSPSPLAPSPLPISSTLAPTPIPFVPPPTAFIPTLPNVQPTVFIPLPTTAPSLTPYPTLTPIPNQPPTEAPASTSAAQTIILRIQARGGESLYIQNMSPDSALRVRGFELRAAQGSVSSSEWTLGPLNTGECLRIQSNADAKPPDGMTCQPKGEIIIRTGDARFWRRDRDSFDIYYDGEYQGTCSNQVAHHSPGCSVRVQVPNG